MEQTDKERRDKIAQILRDGITFSGQVGDYVIHEELDAMLTRWKRNKETAEDHIFLFKLLWAYCDGELVEKNQWISVKDRLPEYGDEYNVVWEFEFSNPVVTTGAIDELIKYNETQVIPLRERLEKVEKENEQLTQWHRDWVSGKWVKEQTANIDRLIKENERLRERLEKVEKALKEARDVLVMASLIDKTSTCMDAVNEIDQLLTKEG